MFDKLLELFDNDLFKSQVKYKIRNFKAKEKILHQDQVHANIYLIKKGKVRVVMHVNTQGKQHIEPNIADLHPNDIFGEFGLFDEAPASADVIALEDSQLVEINISSFRLFLERNPEIGYKILSDLLKTLINRLRSADKTIADLSVWGIGTSNE